MERPKVVVNVRFEDKECSTDRLVDEQFEFELVGSRIHVRPLIHSETTDKKHSPTRKRDALRSARFDEQRKERDKDTWEYPNKGGTSKTLIGENSKKNVSSPDTRSQRSLSPNEELKRAHRHRQRNRHVSRREEYDNAQKQIGPKYVAEVSSRIIGKPSSKIHLGQNAAECGEIRYCLQKEGVEIEESESEDSEASDYSSDDGNKTGKKHKTFTFPQHCEIDCYNGNEGAQAKRHQKRRLQDKRGHQGVTQHKRSPNRKKITPDDSYGSYEEMVEDSIRQFPTHRRRIHDERRKCRVVHTRHSPTSTAESRSISEESVDEGEFNRHHTRKKPHRRAKQRDASKSSSEESSDAEQKEEGKNHRHNTRRRTHHGTRHKEWRKSSSDDSIDEKQDKYTEKKPYDRAKHKGRSAHNADDSSSYSSASESSGTPDEDPHVLKEQKRHHHGEKYYKKKWHTSKHKNHYRKKQLKADVQHKRKYLEEDDGPVQIRTNMMPTCSNVSCSVRCCSNRTKMEDFYNAHLKAQQVKEEKTKKPEEKTKKEQVKSKKEKSSPSLYDFGVRAGEDKK